MQFIEEVKPRSRQNQFHKYSSGGGYRRVSSESTLGGENLILVFSIEIRLHPRREAHQKRNGQKTS